MKDKFSCSPKMHLLLFLQVVGLTLIGVVGTEREHRVHNIVLFREKYSWCKLTPIQQIIASPGYDSVTIDNNICVGACYSYSIPKTQPAEPGEIIGPYCDSCQPNVTKCYHVTLTADSGNLLGPKMLRKQVEIIESCDCKTCSKEMKTDCVFSNNTDSNSSSESIELPQHLYTNKDNVKMTTTNPDASSEMSDADLMKFKPSIATKNHNLETSEVRGEKKFDLNAKLIKLLKTIQNEPLNEDNQVLKYDKDEIRALLDMVEGPEKKFSDKNLLEFVNYVNSNSNIDDFELDMQKLKDVLMRFEKNKDIAEKYRNFWYTGFSDNQKIEDDYKKLHLPDSYGLEGNTLGMKHHYSGSHIGMGLTKTAADEDDAPTLVSLKVTLPSPSSSLPTTTTASISSSSTAAASSIPFNPENNENLTVSNSTHNLENSSKNGKNHHHHHHKHNQHNHFVMEEENIDGRLEHLVRGPHGSLISVPDNVNVKVEEKLNLETNALKPNHQGVVISYTGSSKDEINTPDIFEE